MKTQHEKIIEQYTNTGQELPNNKGSFLRPLREKVKARMRGRGKQCFGFTLIELLVVVLSIGILASVALPQYQRAVDKAQLASYFPAITSLLRAQELYYLANGEYAAKITDLDVDITSVCPSIGGATGKNDLYNCKFGYKLANSASAYGDAFGMIHLALCPAGNNTSAGVDCGTRDRLMLAI